METDIDTRFNTTREAITKNDPPISIGQIWFAPDRDGKKIRRILILAPYPTEVGFTGSMTTKPGERLWIYEELHNERKPSLVDLGRLGICPEFNLRYVFTVETE